MSSSRAVILLAVAALIGLTVGPIGGGAVVGAFTDEQPEQENNTTVSTVLQSTSADTQNAIDAGMFDAEYELADNESRSDVVADRTTELEGQLDELEAERDALREQRDELSNGEYLSRMATLATNIAAIERSAEQTKPRAAETGVGTDRLETLQGNASELAGPDVAAVADGIPGQDRLPGQGPPNDRDGGPPETNQSPTETGPPDDPGTGPDDDSAPGQPDDPGGADDSEGADDLVGEPPGEPPAGPS